MVTLLLVVTMGVASGDGFQVALAADKPTYRSGEPIAFILTLSNRTSQDIRLEFATAQRFDFVIRDAAHREVWRWSGDRMFGQMMESEVIGPVRPEVVYRAQFTGTLPPASYSVEGIVVARARRLSAMIAIEIQ